MENTTKRKVKVGTIVYAVLMVLWAGILCYGTYYLWSSVKTFAGYWEEAQITPKVDAYMEKLESEIWKDGENGVLRTISEMEHPYQTDEQCVEILKEILAGDMRCRQGVNQGQPEKRAYDLLSGRSKFGQVLVKQKPFEPDENALVNWAIEKMDAYPWEVEGVTFYLDGLYTAFEITVPDSYTVLLNGHPLTEENVVETGIHYNVLEGYYEDFDGLPTKTKYRAEKIFGHVDVQLLDGSGNPTEIDPNRDDSQFIEPVSDELFARFDEFCQQFAPKYLQFCAGTGQMWSEYNVLMHYVQKDSDLQSRLYNMILSYEGWTHNYGFTFGSCTLNDVFHIANDIYILDLSADASYYMPTGYTTVQRNLKLYVVYLPGTNEVFAFTLEDYNTEESDFVG